MEKRDEAVTDLFLAWRVYSFLSFRDRYVRAAVILARKASLTGRNNSAPAWCEIISERVGFREGLRGSSIITRNDYASDSAFIGVSKTRCIFSLSYSLELAARRTRRRVSDEDKRVV